MKKYVAVAAGVLMQACLGGIYAWSAFVPALRQAYGYSSAQTQIVFGSTIGMLTTLMLVTGRWQDRIGPRPFGVLAGLFLAAQYLCAGFLGDRFGPLWFSVSVLGGLAVGCGYLCPIATGVKWFPHRKGLITGLAVAGYGGGAILLSAIAQTMLGRGWPVLSIFKAIGLIYGPVTLLMGLLLFTPQRADDHASAPFPLGRLLRDRYYWKLVVGIFCGTFPGLVLIGNLKPIGLAFGVPAIAATGAIGGLAAGNALGRIAWGWIQDRSHARVTAPVCLGLSTVAVLMFLLVSAGPLRFIAASAFLGFCYGGGLSLYAAQTAERYGAERVGSAYPPVLLAHGLAAVIGPPLGGWTFDITGTFTASILMAAAVNLAGVFGYLWLGAKEQRT